LPSAFVLFGSPHVAALALILAAPPLLATLARTSPRLDMPIRWALAALLAGGWLTWFALFAARGWLTVHNALPLNLCDWAAMALIVALLSRSQRAYELGYFWGLGGTVQGLVTPDIAHGFPDPQFFFFFLNHGGIIVALLYLTWGTGLRPHLRALPRVAAATIFYACVAGAVNFMVGTNYAFLRAKPLNPSILDFLAPWPWYIPQLVVIGLLSMLVYYAPFLIRDIYRARRT